MHPRIILAVARKDAIDILLNKSALFNLLLPIFLSVMFWFISSVISSPQSNSVLVYNPGGSSVDQVVLKAFSSSKLVQANSAAEVSSAFGPDGSHKKSDYVAGLIVPDHFESDLRAGKYPALSLFINGDKVGAQASGLIQAAVNNYSWVRANPQPPVQLQMATINPPTSSSFSLNISDLYISMMLLVSFMVGLVFVPQLLIEEKEKKTLRMLMVTPASFGDVVIGKLLIVLVYQVILTGIVLSIQGGFTGQVSMVLLFALLGACFSLAIGLLMGSVFDNAGTAGGIGGIIMMVYVLSGLFSGGLGTYMLGNSPVLQVFKYLPTTYIADGAYNALVNQGSLASNLLDISVLVGSTIVILAVSIWLLRRQSAVAATI